MGTPLGGKHAADQGRGEARGGAKFAYQYGHADHGRGWAANHKVHHALVTAEIALSVTLVIGAGLLVKSFWQVQQEELGFDPEALLTLRVQPPSEQYDEARRRIYFNAVRERLAAVPGVTAAAGIHMLPMTPIDVKLLVMRADQKVPKGERPPWTSARMVTPDLIETLGVPLLRGRQLSTSDSNGAMAVGLVNQTLARQLWGEEDPLGRQLLFDDESPFFTVVGVVGDIRQHRLGSLFGAIQDAVWSLGHRSAGLRRRCPGAGGISSGGWLSACSSGGAS